MPIAKKSKNSNVPPNRFQAATFQNDKPLVPTVPRACFFDEMTIQDNYSPKTHKNINTYTHSLPYPFLVKKNISIFWHVICRFQIVCIAKINC